MKKIMVLAAIVCAAACSFGAAGDWNCVGAFYWDDGNGGELAGTTIYAFDANATGLTSAKVLATLALGDLTVLDDALTPNGTVGSNDAYNFSGTGLEAKDDYYNTFLIALTAEQADGFQYATAKDIPAIQASAEAVIANGAKLGKDWGMAKMPGEGVAGWTQVANVPEPTSGLLLLLGVAGLALKRRRA